MHVSHMGGGVTREKHTATGLGVDLCRHLARLAAASVALSCRPVSAFQPEDSGGPCELRKLLQRLCRAGLLVVSPLSFCVPETEFLHHS